MIRSILLTVATVLLSVIAVSAQTVLKGRITDDKGEALIGATVKVLKGAEVRGGSITDFDGNYSITIDPGSYDLEVSYTGYSTAKTTGVLVKTNQFSFANVSLSTNANLLTDVVITAFKVPLIEQDKTSGGQTITSDQIKNLPTRSVNAIVATTAGTTSIDGGEVSIKGSRPNGTNYYIDGIRVYGGQAPPVQDIEQMQVITGGLGAEYGDATGGVISIITKGPADEYHGAIEVENSHGLDPYGWLLATGNISGPIVKRKVAGGGKETVVGFRLSGQYLTQKDDDPPATVVHRPKQDILDRISASPLVPLNGVPVSRAELLTQDSVDAYRYNPNENRRDIDLTSKLDFRITQNMDFSVTGTFKDIQNQFTPVTVDQTESTTGGSWGNRNWLLLNSQNNPTEYQRRIRGIARFRHRLGSNDPSTDKAKSGGVAISNASYQLQLGYERFNRDRYDPRHKDNLFDYGYIGRFDFTPIPVAGPSGNRIQHVGDQIAFQGFRPGYEKDGNVVIPNPGLVAYNQYANPELFTSYIARNGQFTDIYRNVWGTMHSNINQVYDNYEKREEEYLTIQASAGFDLRLGKKSVHSIQFGLLNEQRVQRDYQLDPFGLWNLMNLSANAHFNGLDTTKVIGRFFDPFWSPQIGDSIRRYANAVTDLRDARFYRSIREKTGTPLDRFVNVNRFGPDMYSLDMFSASELTNFTQGDNPLLTYYGYDHTGRRLGNGVTFNDFFTARDADNRRTFPVAPLQPLYQAFFIKDKFTIDKMIFSVGVRVERFDLNTKVLRDQYSLYEVMPATVYHQRYANVAGKKPDNIGDDYKVYTVSQSDLRPKAYRNGNTWYFADGRQANDGNVIFGGGVVSPILLDTVAGDDIADPRFNPNGSFGDYTPQVNWMPRLAFSFPISEDANFFAHYDVMVQRPQSDWEVTALSYLYFYTAGRTPTNNANLLPERTVDYEVGFQQRLNQNSAIKLSAFYREMRDMLQRRTILYVPVIGRYDTYGNIDFGTIKGFTMQYDLRRVQNAELRLAYTLQFADGTGSDANSQRGLTGRGNIRTLYPLNFDERHNFNAILDYRFASGKAYNGPRINGKDILSNFGVNIQTLAVSGRPYTATLRPVQFGGEGRTAAINGNRRPWRFNVDLRVDKSFALTSGTKKPLNLNVYFRVSNVLNRQNIISVYSNSGSPTDDGYLASLEGQSVVRGVTEQGRDARTFLSSYSWAMLNPDNFTLPRRMYVGGVFEF
jgi:outer membrane receptor protein involved in Fe transport